MKPLMGLCLLVPTLAISGPCYTITKKKTNWCITRKFPPFDLSGPPDSKEYSNAKAKGLSIAHFTNLSKKSAIQLNVDIVHELANDSHRHIATAIYAQQQQEEYQSTPTKFQPMRNMNY